MIRIESTEVRLKGRLALRCARYKPPIPKRIISAVVRRCTDLFLFASTN
jgi:hypothetical protein